MIKEIPKAKDYEKTALALLNLAWENSLTFVLTLDEAEEFADVSLRKSDQKKYWKAAQTQLATAISLVQQAQEFSLKSRICAVSPFLLITGSPREWPKEGKTQDIAFSEFRTIDAQELISAHDTVAATRLPQTVKTFFEAMRKLRNRIIHTVDKGLRIEVAQVVLAVLEIATWFAPSKSWISIRLQRVS